MDTSSSKPQNKRGAKPKGLNYHLHILVTKELKEWVDQHPDGPTALTRRLLQKEFDRQRKRREGA